MRKLNSKTQNLIVFGTIAAVILIGISSYIVWSAYSFFGDISSLSNKVLPEEIAESRILKGNGFLKKTEIFKLNQINYSQTLRKNFVAGDEKERQRVIGSDIAKGIYGFSDIKLCNGEITAVGQFGAYVFDLEGNLKREILFEPTVEKLKIGWYEQNHYKQNLDNVRVVELKKDAPCGFTSFSSTAGATVFDYRGNIVWNYGKTEINLSELWSEQKSQFEEEAYVTQAAAGDLNGDDTAEYIIARNNDGVRVFDQNGQEKWFRSSKFPSNDIHVVDLDVDGKNELLEIGRSSNITAGNGEIIKNFKCKNEFLILKEENGKKILQLFDINDNKLNVVDENGKQIIEAEAPLSNIKLKEPRKVKNPFYPQDSYEFDSESIYNPKAIWVRLQNGKDYLAIIGKFIGLPRAQFYVYDQNGQLVYQELLPEDAETIMALPKADKTEEILVGGKDTIWKFSLN